MHVKIPYIVNNSTDPFEYLPFNGVTDKFGLCKKFENLIVSSSDKSKIYRTQKTDFLYDISVEIVLYNFYLNIFSFDQKFRGYCEK